MKKLGILALTLVMSIVLVACGGDEEKSSSDDQASGDLGEKDLKLSYVEWDSEVASTHVMQKILEEAGYNVEVNPLDNAIMWEAVANGEADASVSAWLPVTHKDLYEKHKDDIDDLGENLKGAKIGLVVPKDFPVDSIEDLSKEADQKITGIEPGAGVVQAAEKAVEEYDNLSDWEVVTSSSAAMAQSLGDSIDSEDEIIVTGWSPHWKFQKYDLKYLDDPKGVFGEEEHINTFARKGLEEDSPKAYEILDSFEWSTEEMEKVMLDIQEGSEPSEAAEKWVEDNSDKVKEIIGE